MNAADEAPLSRADLATLRHELRTPFNALIGYAEMLLEVGYEAEPVLASVRQLLATVNEAVPSGAVVCGRDLAALGRRLAGRLDDLDEQVAGLAVGVKAAGIADDLRDVDRLRAAAETLRQVVSVRLFAGPAPVCIRPAAAVPAVAAPADARGVVLVVDDNEANRDLLRLRLRREGYAAVEACDGGEALERLAAGGFDLVLLDVLMPVVDGFEVLRRVKGSPALRDLPVIMISAYDEMDSVVRCIEMGAEDYLPKPFDPVLLRARVGASLEKKRLRDQELEYLRGVAALQVAASAVEAGAFDPAGLAAVAGRGDELGRLARVFTRMAQEVRAREQRLRDEVTQLRIEIDEARKARQVEEITGSGFFESLQQKAERLRRRLGKEG